MDSDILPELRNRKSPLLFNEKDVDKAQLDLLIEAARWAPSCYNNQSWNYVFSYKNDPARKDFEAALSSGNWWAKKAPYLVAVGANPEEDCKTNDLPYYAYDAGLSVMSLTIEAERHGLRVHQMAGWQEGKVKEALGFPEGFRVIVVFAVGYEADAANVWDELDEKTRNRITKPRQRKAATENFRFGTFRGLNPRSS